MTENGTNTLYDKLRDLLPGIEGDCTETRLIEELRKRLSSEESEFSEEAVEQDLIRSTELRNSALNVLKRFENQLLSASISQSESEEEDDDANPVSPVPEFLDEDKNRLRTEAFETLRHLFLRSQESKSPFSSRFYETVVYDVVSDRIRRNLGYYQALYRADEEIKRI